MRGKPEKPNNTRTDMHTEEHVNFTYNFKNNVQDNETHFIFYLGRWVGVQTYLAFHSSLDLFTFGVTDHGEDY